MPFHPGYDKQSGLFYGYWFAGWLDVPGYEGLYEVNHLSQVRNKKTGNICKPGSTFRVTLYNTHHKPSTHFAYHLSLAAFFPLIPRNGRTADHSDENRNNNSIENLQWMILSENVGKSLKLRPRSKGIAAATSKPVEQWDCSGKTFLKVFASIREAARSLNLHNGHISSCANGKQRTAGGFQFRFAYQESQEDLPGEIWKTNDVLKAMFNGNEKVRISNVGRIMNCYGVKKKGSKANTESRTGHRTYNGYLVHQLVWAVWGDGRPVPKKGDGLVICHDDSQPKDEDGCMSNAIAHLRLDTQSANAREHWEERKKAKKRTLATAEITATENDPSSS